MAVVERSITINASPQTIDAIAVNSPQRVPEWFAGMESSAPDGTYPAVGGKMDAVYKAAGLTFHLVITTTEYVPGDRFVMQMEGMIAGTQSWTLTPAGEGTTMTVVFDYHMPGGGLGKIADKLVAERMNTKNLEQSLASLKALIEREA